MTSRPSDSTRRRPAVALLVAILVAGSVWADVAWADARDLFKEAMDGVEAKNWTQVESKLRQAIELDPAADKRTFVKDYLPHYWLGVALQEQGDCRGASAAWDESERQGVASGSSDAADLSRRRASCRQALEQLAQAVSQARDAAAGAREADQTLARMSGSAELAAHWAPYENRRQAARQKLAEAERSIERGDEAQDVDRVREAADTASQVTSQLLTIAADARAKAGQVGAASTRAQGDIEEAESSASSALRAVQALEPLPPELAAQAEEVRTLLAEIEDVRRRDDPRRMRDHSRQVAAAIRQLKNMAAPPPTWLTTAAQSFLDQDYVSALSVVEVRLGRDPQPGAERSPGDLGGLAADELPPLEDRERFHALLLAAASRHQLWVATGKEDAGARRQLEADLAAAAELEAAAGRSEGGISLGRASQRFFSPDLRQLWVEALAAQGLEPPAPQELVAAPAGAEATDGGTAETAGSS